MFVPPPQAHSGGDDAFNTFKPGESFYGFPGTFPAAQQQPQGFGQFQPSVSLHSAPSTRIGGGVDYSDEPPLLEELGVNFGAIGAKTSAVLMLHKPVDAMVLRDADLAGPLVFCVVLGLCLLLVSRACCIFCCGQSKKVGSSPHASWALHLPLSLLVLLLFHQPLSMSPTPPLLHAQSGKLHFGYIYGFGLLGCIGMCTIVNLMQSSNEHLPAAMQGNSGSVNPPVHLGLTLTISMLGYCLLPIVLLAALAVFVNLHGVQGVVLGMAAILWSTLSCARFFESALHMSDRKWLIAYPAGLFYACFALMVSWCAPRFKRVVHGIKGVGFGRALFLLTPPLFTPHHHHLNSAGNFLRE